MDPQRPPRARYLLGAADIDHFAQSHDSLHAPAFAYSVPPIIDAGLGDPVETAWPSLARPTQEHAGHNPGI